MLSSCLSRENKACLLELQRSESTVGTINEDFLLIVYFVSQSQYFSSVFYLNLASASEYSYFYACTIQICTCAP